MYTLTRQQTAEILGISTRSVDRYVKSGKLRSKKEWKIIYIHESDVSNISGSSPASNPQVIVQEKKTSYTQEKRNGAEASSTAVMDAQSRATLEKIYLDLRGEIQTKDKAIQDLSIKLGQAQEIAKNSVSLIEFKKSQFLLEESKWHLAGELTDLKNKEESLREQLKYEKSTNYILIAFCLLLVISVWVLWFIKI